MPQKIICGSCRHTLYCGDELVNPDEVINKYNRICPECSKLLTLNPERVEVKKIQNYDLSK